MSNLQEVDRPLINLHNYLEPVIGYKLLYMLVSIVYRINYKINDVTTKQNLRLKIAELRLQWWTVMAIVTVLKTIFTTIQPTGKPLSD